MECQADLQQSAGGEREYGCSKKFVQAVKDTGAQILGLSTLLTTTMLGMRDVIRALEQAQLREKVKVLVGGAPVTHTFAKEIGADGYGESAAVAVDKAKQLLRLN